MKRLSFYFALAATGFLMPLANAQTVNDSVKKSEEKLSNFDKMIKERNEERKKEYIESLKNERKNIEDEEKYRLRKKVEEITSNLENGKITPEEAQKQKEAAAKLAALNIENKTAIIDNKLSLADRDEGYSFEGGGPVYFEAGYGNATDDKGSFILGIRYNAENKKMKYDKRTYSDIVFALGGNNTVGGGQEIGDLYDFNNSLFAEIGLAFRTRLLKNSNAIRLVYGLSYQFNKLSPKGNKYFVNDNGTTMLEEFPYDLGKNSKRFMRIDNLVLPVHFEFGPSRKVEHKDYFRYDNILKFNAGIGGYIGINTGATQRLQYKRDGVKFVEKIRTDYNVNKFIYGLSAYVGIGGGIAAYVKYDLNTVFENSPYKDHNISFALRWDL